MSEDPQLPILKILGEVLKALPANKCCRTQNRAMVEYITRRLEEEEILEQEGEITRFNSP